MTDSRAHRARKPAKHPGKPRQAARWTLTDEDRAQIHAAIDALPPLTDEQIDAICDIIIAARKRRQHHH